MDYDGEISRDVSGGRRRIIPIFDFLSLAGASDSSFRFAFFPSLSPFALILSLSSSGYAQQQKTVASSHLYVVVVTTIEITSAKQIPETQKSWISSHQDS